MLATLARNITTDTSGPAIAIDAIGMLPFDVSSAQGSVVTGGVIGTNRLDNTATGYESVGGTDLLAEVVVTTAFTTGAGMTSLTVAAWTHSTTTITSGTLLASVTVPLADVDAIGDRITLRIPKAALARYTGLVYTAVGGNPGAGAVTASITPDLIPGAVVDIVASAAGTGSAVVTIDRSHSGLGSWYRDTSFSLQLDANTSRQIQYLARTPFIRATVDVTGTTVVNATVQAA